MILNRMQMILIKLRKSDVEKGKVDKKNYDTNDGH